MSNKSSLLMRASLVAVLAVAPVAATVFVIQSDLLKPGPDAAREGALRQARDASAQLGRFVGELKEALAAAADAPAIRNGDPAGCADALAPLKRRFGDQVLIGANAADGWAVCNTAGVAPRTLRNGERSSHQLPLQSGAFAVGGWEPGTGPRNSGLHLGVPIQAEGGIGFAGTVAAAVEVARLAETLRGVTLPAGAELVLVDRNDRVVVRLGSGGDPDLKPGDPAPASLSKLLPAVGGTDADAAKAGLVPGKDARGAERLVALAPYVPGTEGALRLLVSFDPSTFPAAAAAPTVGPLPMDMAVSLGGLALALVVAFAGARVLLSRPLAEALAAAAASDAPRPSPPGSAPAAVRKEGDSEALLALALQTGNLGAWELDAATGRLTASEGFDAVFGYGRPVGGGWTWRRFLRHVLPEDRAAAEEAFRDLRAGPCSVSRELRVHREGDGALRVLHLRAVHHRSPDGRVRIFGVVADATPAAADPAPAPAAPRPADYEARISLPEVGHRIRGLLTTVQALAAETLRAPPGTGGLIPAAAKQAFEARLGAIARSHEVLVREDGERADLSELVNLVLAPHAVGTAGPRLTAEGPVLSLPARIAMPLAVALHELATNAARFGALSQPGGKVEATWTLEEVGPGAAPMLRFRWEEKGGPPVEGPPKRRGFGLRLLESGLGREIGGLVTVDFRPTGLVCEIEAPLKTAAAPAKAAAV